MENKQFEIEGLKEITDALKELPVEIQQKILRSFVRKAGKKFIVDEMKQILPKTLKTRKGQIGQEEFIKVINSKEDGLAVQAGVTGKGYKLRWTDLGTEERKTKKGANRGRITGKHQIQPLIERQTEEIVKYTEQELGNDINKMLLRRLKKLKKSI